MSVQSWLGHRLTRVQSLLIKMKFLIYTSLSLIMVFVVVDEATTSTCLSEGQSCPLIEEVAGFDIPTFCCDGLYCENGIIGSQCATPTCAAIGERCDTNDDSPIYCCDGLYCKYGSGSDNSQCVPVPEIPDNKTCTVEGNFCPEFLPDNGPMIPCCGYLQCDQNLRCSFPDQLPACAVEFETCNDDYEIYCCDGLQCSHNNQCVPIPEIPDNKTCTAEGDYCPEYHPNTLSLIPCCGDLKCNFGDGPHAVKKCMSGGKSEGCLFDGESCRQDEDCCGLCNKRGGRYNNLCVSGSQTCAEEGEDCPPMLPDMLELITCCGDLKCNETFKCVDTFPCAFVGESCGQDEDCCSGVCKRGGRYNNLCVSGSQYCAVEGEDCQPILSDMEELISCCGDLQCNETTFKCVEVDKCAAEGENCYEPEITCCAPDHFCGGNCQAEDPFNCTCIRDDSYSNITEIVGDNH